MKIPEIYEKKGSLVFPVRVQPRADRNRITGVYAGALKVAIASPPLENRANQELIRYLARALGVKPSRCRLLSGLKSKNKKIQVDGMARAELAARLQALLGVDSAGNRPQE